MIRSPLTTATFGLLFFGVLAILVAMMWDFLSPIFFGFILAGVLSPGISFLRRHLGWSRSRAALALWALVVLCLFFPIGALAVRLMREIVDLVDYLTQVITTDDVDAFLASAQPLPTALRRLGDLLGADVNSHTLERILQRISRSGATELLSTLNDTVTNAFGLVLDLCILLTVLLALFLEGPRLKRFLFKLSPLPQGEEELIVAKINQMNMVSLVYNGLGGVLQGTLAGLLFWGLGIGSPLLWAAVMVVLAFIPIAGISFVYLPATAWLILTDQPGAAAILFVTCSAIWLGVEYGLKPRFMGGHVQISSVVLLFSIVGGVSLFGIGGIFYGPVFLAMFLTLVDIYHDHYKPKSVAEADG